MDKSTGFPYDSFLYFKVYSRKRKKNSKDEGVVGGTGQDFKPSARHHVKRLNDEFPVQHYC